MMCALSILFMRYQIFGSVINGMIIVIFVIYFGSMGGYRYLLPIYGCTIYRSGRVHGRLQQSFNKSFTHVIESLRPDHYRVYFFQRYRSECGTAGSKARTMLETTNPAAGEKNRVIEKNHDLMQKQMKLARVIQHNLIPKNVPNRENLEIHAIYMPIAGNRRRYVRLHPF